MGVASLGLAGTCPGCLWPLSPHLSGEEELQPSSVLAGTNVHAECSWGFPSTELLPGRNVDHL